VAKKYSSVFSTAAVYPHENRDYAFENLCNSLEKFVEENRAHLVGIGETGIDISNRSGSRCLEDQLVLFEFQANLANKQKLPLIVHSRDGDKEVLDMLIATGVKSGVIHCFSSDWQFAESVLDLGFFISFSGLITYKSRSSLLEIVKKVPMDRFLVETDSPYLPPEGHRGEKNQPKYVKIIARRIAEVKGISLEEVARAATTNTERLFNI
jgi:TatD DNase family protein